MERQEGAKESKIRPIADVSPIWENDEGYPVGIRVPMEDGKVLTFWLDRPDAAQLSYQKAIDIIRKWRKQDEVIGYKARHLDKKERRREWLSRAASRK